MFAGPVLLVGGWGWWSSRRIKRQGGGGARMDGDGPASGAEPAPLDLVALGLADDFELPELEDDAPLLAAR